MKRSLIILLMLVSCFAKGQTKLNYAAMVNHAYLVTKAGNEALRKKASATYCNALITNPDIENKAFLISLLEICGTEKAVPVLKQHLLHKRLGDPAARALISIGSPEAKVALLAALRKAKGNNRVTLIAAVGQLRYYGAVDELTVLTDSKELPIRRAALQALANVGDADSEPVLAAAAAKSQYKADSTGATAAYLLYAQRLAQNWPLKPAVIAAEKLLKKTKETPFRIAALKIVVQTRSTDANMILMKEVEDPDPEYRAAAFKMATNNITSENVSNWVLKVERSSGAVKAGIITLLGNSQQIVGLRTVRIALADEDPQVKLAAVWAVGQSSGRDMGTSLLRTMKTADSTCVLAIRDVLLHCSGLDVISNIKASIPSQPPYAQALLKEVLIIRNSE